MEILNSEQSKEMYWFINYVALLFFPRKQNLDSHLPREKQEKLQITTFTVLDLVIFYFFFLLERI